MARVADNGLVPQAPTPSAVFGAAFLALLGGALALLLPMVGVPLAAGALAWLAYRRRMIVAVVVAIAAGLALWPVDPAAVLYVSPWLIVAGPLSVLLLRRWRMTSVVLTVTAVLAGVMLGGIWYAAAANDLGLQAYVAEIVESATGPATETAIEAGQPETEVREQIEAVEELFLSYWPSMVLVVSGITALLSVAVVAVVALRSGQRVRAPLSLQRFDLSPHTAWGVIAALVLMAAARFGGEGFELVGTLGENILLIMRWVFFVQGVAVFAGLYERAGFSRASRAIGFVVLGVTEALLPLVSLTGLADLWVNVRKLPRDGSAEDGGGNGPISAAAGHDESSAEQASGSLEDPPDSD